MSAPSGSELQVAWGFESAELAFQGYDATSGLGNGIYVRNLTGVHAAPVFEKNDNLSSRRAPKKGRIARFNVLPKFSTRPDVDSIVRQMAHFDRKYAISDLTGAYRWTTEPWLPGDSEPGTYIDSFSAEFDTGDDRPVLHHGLRMSGWNLKIQDGKLLDLSMDWMGCRDTYHGTVEEVSVNAAFTGRVIVFGHRGDSDTSSASIKFKCITAGGSGAATVSFTRDGTAYGATEHTVTYGTPIRVTLADDSRAGIDRFQELYVVFYDSSGADSELTIDDEWEIPLVRTAASPSFSTKNPLMTAGVTVSIGGTEYALRNVEVQASKPRVPFFGTRASGLGGLYARTIQDTGRRMMRFVFDRDADDLTIFHKMKEASSFALIVDMFGDPIGATAFDEEWKITVAAAQITNLVRDVPNENTLPERIEVEAFDNGSDDLYQQVITCGVSAIA